MAIKFEKIQPGMVLADVHRERSVMRPLGLWYVRIISVDAEKRTALVSWNSNPPKEWRESDLTRLYPPDKLPKAYRDQQEREMVRRAER